MNISDLEAVNAECNALPFRFDPERYNSEDFWVEADAAGGDCEDTVLAKLHRLLKRGWPIDHMRIGCCYVETGEYHAVLEVMTEDGPRILDNRHQWPMTLEQLRNIGYRPDRIQREGGSMQWKEWKWEA